MATVYEERARVFKALCDQRRQRILELLRGGEKCACVLIEEMEMPQSSLSYHMKILCDSGIVTSREEGKWTHYQISRQGSEKAIALLREITAVTETPDGCESCCQ
ncbi:ArsR/SmtB family transcription factor [Dysosmobacter sp.]|uniref:ArsR/SmtB family transcription factor n=1 Tax=Dysosmobacter sp. TaxID=2591382 RepID=UPI002A8E2D7C|nr:metalloregulator ArsR/SmtB family transcription factor [Dysosmobacter sp.]MDY3282762.1 metalloregulator ArsR/SmtB family transcription factor [Dysosmobacter sp.]